LTKFCFDEQKKNKLVAYL